MDKKEKKTTRRSWLSLFYVPRAIRTSPLCGGRPKPIPCRLRGNEWHCLHHNWRGPPQRQLTRSCWPPRRPPPLAPSAPLTTLHDADGPPTLGMSRACMSRQRPKLNRRHLPHQSSDSLHDCTSLENKNATPIKCIITSALEAAAIKVQTLLPKMMLCTVGALMACTRPLIGHATVLPEHVVEIPTTHPDRTPCRRKRCKSSCHSRSKGRKTALLRRRRPHAQRMTPNASRQL